MGSLSFSNHTLRGGYNTTDLQPDSLTALSDARESYAMVAGDKGAKRRSASRKLAIVPRASADTQKSTEPVQRVGTRKPIRRGSSHVNQDSTWNASDADDGSEVDAEEGSVDDNEQTEGEQRVETLLRSMTMRGGGMTARRVLVKWISLSYEESTWEPLRNLHPEALRDFEWKRRLPFALSELLELPPHVPIEVLAQERLLPIPTIELSDTESETEGAGEDPAGGPYEKDPAVVGPSGSVLSEGPGGEGTACRRSARAREGTSGERHPSLESASCGGALSPTRAGKDRVDDSKASGDAIAAEEVAVGMVEDDEWLTEGHEFVGRRVAHLYVEKSKGGKGEESVQLGTITKWVPADEEAVYQLLTSPARTCPAPWATSCPSARTPSLLPLNLVLPALPVLLSPTTHTPPHRHSPPGEPDPDRFSYSTAHRSHSPSPAHFPLTTLMAVSPFQSPAPSFKMSMSALALLISSQPSLSITGRRDSLSHGSR